mmetsp:Transcript_33553/g.76710  ORF Transcript_33553/g.76710 Transcript_33553/m.76710 type:complete len:227 (-) Transcript_33553:593-1273(-)
MSCLWSTRPPRQLQLLSLLGCARLHLSLLKQTVDGSNRPLWACGAAAGHQQHQTPGAGTRVIAREVWVPRQAGRTPCEKSTGLLPRLGRWPPPRPPGRRCTPSQLASLRPSRTNSRSSRSGRAAARHGPCRSQRRTGFWMLLTRSCGRATTPCVAAPCASVSSRHCTDVATTAVAVAAFFATVAAPSELVCLRRGRSECAPSASSRRHKGTPRLRNTSQRSQSLSR